MTPEHVLLVITDALLAHDVTSVLAGNNTAKFRTVNEHHEVQTWTITVSVSVESPTTTRLVSA